MNRKKDMPQRTMMREFMQSYLKENNVKIKDGADVNSLMQDMMFAILEGTLDEEMKQDLDYSKLTIAIRTLLTVIMDILERLCTPVLEICRSMFRGSKTGT